MDLIVQHVDGAKRTGALTCVRPVKAERLELPAQCTTSPSAHRAVDRSWVRSNLRHRNTEFLKFLRVIDREVPKGLQIKEWLTKHPRFHLHFTPTSSSWLNLVKRWFRELTGKAIRRGVFHSVNDLVTAIEDYLRANNDNPKPFLWTATTEQILAKVARGRVTLQ